MSEVTDAVIDRMVAAIVAEADPEMVILFGSRGRGGLPGSFRHRPYRCRGRTVRSGPQSSQGDGPPPPGAEAILRAR